MRWSSEAERADVQLFVVVEGAVEVTIEGNVTPVGPMSTFMVPRGEWGLIAVLTSGNNYSIANMFTHPATLHFAQARKVTQNEEERALARKKKAEDRRAERERDRAEMDPEDFDAKWSNGDEPIVVDDLSEEDGTGLSDAGAGPSFRQDVSASDRSASATPEPEPEPEPQVPIKRGRGRPRKNPEIPKGETASRGRRRGRGRGRA